MAWKGELELGGIKQELPSAGWQETLKNQTTHSNLTPPKYNKSFEWAVRKNKIVEAREILVLLFTMVRQFF